MRRLRYLDFELKIERAGNDYTARLLRSPAGEAVHTFSLPFSEDRLELLVLKLARPRSATRSTRTQEMEAARELGGRLFEAVFDGEVRACFRTSLNEVARQEGTGLRLKLRLQDVPELANIPIEFLFDSSMDRFIAQSNQTPIVRYIEMPQRIRPIKTDLPLNILVMISSPYNYLELDIELEREKLKQALEPLTRDRKVYLEWLENASLSTLQRYLRSGEYHILHYIGHGGFDPKTEEGVLILEDEEGRGLLAGAHRLGTLLFDHRSLRLAVLNACEGARNSQTDPFAGVASSLIRQGIPAVVAMQFEITDEAAIAFTAEFYAAMADGYPVDAAVAEARKAVYAMPNDVEWGTPVLYTRAQDGELFALEAGPAPGGRPSTSPAKDTPAVKTPAGPRTSPGASVDDAGSRIPRPEQPKASSDQTPVQEQPPLKADRSTGIGGYSLGSGIAEHRELQVQITRAALKQRLMSWAKEAGYKLDRESRLHWELEFKRGSRWGSLVSFDIRKAEMIMVVEIIGDNPTRVSLTLEAKTLAGYLFSPGDRKRLVEELNRLEGFITSSP